MCLLEANREVQNAKRRNKGIGNSQKGRVKNEELRMKNCPSLHSTNGTGAMRCVALYNACIYPLENLNAKWKVQIEK